MAKADLTAARLREVLDYNPETGAFFWRVFRSGRAIPGQQAARAPRLSGYATVFVDGYLYAAHRLAWLHATGAWPAGVIDHIDGNKTNNVLANLRDIPQAHNIQNQRRAQADNLLGVLGVTHHPKNNTFQARITVEGRTRSLGYFKCAEDAHAVYLEAKRLLHAGNTL